MDWRVLIKGVCLMLAGAIPVARESGDVWLGVAAGLTALAAFLDRGSARLGKPET